MFPYGWFPFHFADVFFSCAESFYFDEIPSLYGQLIFNKGDRGIKWSNNSLFNKWFWEIYTATCQKMKLDHQLTLYTKINSRWIKDLNMNCDTIKVLEENIGRKISGIPCSSIFIDMFPRARGIKDRKSKWD